jgi:hypothetical protein
MTPDPKSKTGITLEMALLLLILACIVIAVGKWLFF